MENYRLNDLNDLEIITPTECEGYPGYFYIPGYPEYGISREGKVIKVKAIDRERHLGKEIRSVVDRLYYRLSLRNNNGNKSNALHRLVAKTFVGRPSRHLDKPLDELHVNHVDANKLNNHYTNLEWVTAAENVKHANTLGLIAKQNPVLIKDIRTNNIERIRNIEDCAKRFNMPSNTLYQHLKSLKASTVTKDWHVFKLDDGSEWKPIRPDRQVENAWYQIDRWITKNVVNNKTVIADNIYDLADAINVTQSRIHRHVNERKSNEALDDWLIQIKYENISQEEIQKNPKFIKGQKDSLKVKATNLLTKEEKIYESLGRCAKAHGIRHGALSWIINRSKTKSKNGFEFEFV